MSRHTPTNVSHCSLSQYEHISLSGDGLNSIMHRMDESMIYKGDSPNFYSNFETPVIPTGHVTKHMPWGGRSPPMEQTPLSQGQMSSNKSSPNSRISQWQETLKATIQKLIVYSQTTKNLVDEQEEFINRFLAHRNEVKERQDVLDGPWPGHSFNRHRPMRTHRSSGHLPNYQEKGPYGS